MPGRMAWVNGCGYQRACSYRHNAAVAERSVAFCFLNARQDRALFVCFCFDQPNRRIRTRKSGGVGGGSREATPYPDSQTHAAPGIDETMVDGGYGARMCQRE